MHNKNGMRRKYAIEPGAKYGRLTLVERTAEKVSGRPICVWKCACGNTHDATLVSVSNANRYGGSKGCPDCVSKHQSKAATQKYAKRHRDITAEYIRGDDIESIIARHKITKQRIFQIVTKNSTPAMVDAGLRKLSLEQFQKAMKALKLSMRRRIYLAAIHGTKGKGKSS